MSTEIMSMEKRLVNSYFELYPEEAAKYLSDFPSDEIINYLSNQTLEVSTNIFRYLNPDISSGLIEKLDNELFVKIFTNLDPNIAARLLSRLDEQVFNAKLSILAPNLAKEINIIINYPPNTAGYIIDTKVATFFPDDKVETVLKRVRKLKNRKRKS